MFEPNRRAFVHVMHEQISPRGIDWKIDAAWQRIDDDRRTRDFEATERRFEANRSDLYGLTLNASGTRGVVDWIGGVDLYYDEVRSSRREENLVSGLIELVAPRFPDGSTIGQAGFFVRGDWHAGQRHRLSIGMRYTDVDIELPDGTTIDPGRFSGDVGWIFDIDDAWQITANLGNGFRAPNIADIGTLGNRPGNRFNVPNTSLGAETVTHLDFGLRYHAAQWHAELVAYGLHYDDRIVSVDTGETTVEGRDIVQSVNAASSRLHGIEGGLSASLTDRLRLRAALQYTRGTQRVAGAEEPADRVPPLQARLSLRFRQSDAWTYEAWIVAADAQERLSARDVRDARIDPQGTPGWTRIGGLAHWRSAGGWEVMAGIDNLLDHRYRVHGSGLDAPGRNLSLTLRHRW